MYSVWAVGSPIGASASAALRAVAGTLRVLGERSDPDRFSLQPSTLVRDTSLNKALIVTFDVPSLWALSVVHVGRVVQLVSRPCTGVSLPWAACGPLASAVAHQFTDWGVGSRLHTN